MRWALLVPPAACAFVTCALVTPGCTLPAGAPCCAEDTDCSDGARCFEGRCAPLCDDDSQCEEGEGCDADVGVCRARRSDDGCVTRTDVAGGAAVAAVAAVAIAGVAIAGVVGVEGEARRGAP